MAYKAFQAPGVPLADYPGETLQCRRETVDEDNWQELRDICRGMIALEREWFPEREVFGEFLIPEPGIRCTSNRFIRPTANATLIILDTVRAWAMAGQANHWRLKDLCWGAPTREALEAVDMTEGWP